MTLSQQEAHFERVLTICRNIMFRKGNDYSTSKDRLSNFKLAGNIAGITAEVNCLSLIATKVARLGVLLAKSTAPNNESIEDSIIDLINYGILLYMLNGEAVAENANTVFGPLEDSTASFNTEE